MWEVQVFLIASWLDVFTKVVMASKVVHSIFKAVLFLEGVSPHWIEPPFGVVTGC